MTQVIRKPEPLIETAQAEVWPFPRNSAPAPAPAELYTANPALEYAYLYHDIGLNPIPGRAGSKGANSGLWREFQYIKAPREILPRFFDGSIPRDIRIMCGKTSSNLFVIDCDSPAAGEYQREKCHAAGLKTWVAQTKRGIHIYFFSATGELKNVAPGVMLDAEVRASRCYVKAAPAAGYEWIEQPGSAPLTIDPALINWLTDKNGVPIVLHPVKVNKRAGGPGRGFYTPLNKSTRAYLKNGGLTAESTRNKELFSAACDFAAAHQADYSGFTQHHALDQLGSRATASGLPFAETAATIASAYSSTRTLARNSSAAEKLRFSHAQQASAYATTVQFAGRAGDSRRRVLSALILRCQNTPNTKGIFRATEREIAELAGLSQKTVSSVLNDLRNGLNETLLANGQRVLKTPGRNPDGTLLPATALIRYAGRDTTAKPGTRAYTTAPRRFAFSEPVLSAGAMVLALKENAKTPESTAIEVIHKHGVYSAVLSGVLELEQQLAERGALGGFGLALYRAILDLQALGKVKLSQAAAAAGCSYKQAEYRASRLIALNLVVKSGRFYMAYPATLEQIKKRVTEDFLKRHPDNGQRVHKMISPVERPAVRKATHAKERGFFAGEKLLRSLAYNDAVLTPDKAATPRKRVLVAVDTTTGEITPLPPSMAQLIASAGLPLDLKITKNGKTQ